MLKIEMGEVWPASEGVAEIGTTLLEERLIISKKKKKKRVGRIICVVTEILQKEDTGTVRWRER